RRGSSRLSIAPATFRTFRERGWGSPSSGAACRCTAAASASTASPAAARPSKCGCPMRRPTSMSRILLIEDEAPIRLTLSRFLRMEGWEVLTAEDGAKGVALALAELPDLIICDLLMPELDGYQVLSSLRSDPRTESIPFLLLTASAGQEEHEAGLQRGAA